MNLAKTQLISLVTKGITTALGILQSVIVIRILSPAEFGLVGLVMSVGGLIGVSQHLGIVDGAIREIAVLKKKKDVGKVFWVSHMVRQLVTIPLSLLLLLSASFIATKIYGRPEIALLLQIFSAALVLQGLQDVLGATLTGMKKFVSLYIVQIITASINVVVFAYFTWRYGISGFFGAVIVTTTIMVTLLAAVIGRNLKGYLAWPSWPDVRQYAWRVMRIGAFMYLARIFFIVWQRLPILVLGGVLTADELGFLNVSTTFGSKLTIIAMALSEVNLSWMSSLYTHRREEFQRVVTRNMHRVLVLMMLITLVLLFFTPEILRYVIGTEYLPAQPIILVMTLGFFLYALTDIGTSSVFVPADKPRLRALTFGLMTAVSGTVIAFLLLARPDSFLAALAVLAGALVSYISVVWLAKKRFGVALLTGQLFLFLVALGLGVLWLLSDPSLLWRMLVYVLLLAFIVWEIRRSDLMPRWAGMNHGDQPRIICFAGATFNQPTWTNRQHIMSRVAKQYPVLYVEPRVWIVRYVAKHWRQPRQILSFIKRIVWIDKVSDKFFVKAQWNLIPGSREVKLIARLNHWLNRWNILFTAKLLGFGPPDRRADNKNKDVNVVWIYDTEAAEFLSAFKREKVLYDCVDDHAAQAGPDRNSKRVNEEEEEILKRADLVTVTSQRLYELKRAHNDNVQLVLNAGDVKLYAAACSTPGVFPANLDRPILGTVGTLDAYKFDFDLLHKMATENPQWSFVFIGAPVVDPRTTKSAGLRSTDTPLDKLTALSNVHMVGTVPRQEVPAYVASFDVCLIPYRDSRYNAASFPLKFWEFMATGKPVVVTGLPELKPYSHLIGYAQSASKFVADVKSYLAEPNLASEERQTEALKHSWEMRVEQLLSKLKEIL